jgi:hypothetical protein
MSDYRPPSYRAANPVTVPGLWLTIFSATLVAILVGSLIVAVATRAYLRWSVQDTMRSLDEKSPRR